VTVLLSNLAKTALLAAFPIAFNGGHIRVFGGARPASPNGAQAGSLLGTITRNGLPAALGAPAALTFVQQGPYILHDPDELWTLTVIASGSATWFRLVADVDDPGDADASRLRIDGTASDFAGAGELRMPNTALVANTVLSPLSFIYTIPPL